jgi:IS4 transposase
MGIWIIEIEYRQNVWSNPKRIVIVKQQEEVRKKETGKKLKTLFDSENIDEEKAYKARYHCFVTNQNLPATQIWKQYKQRGDAENRLKELKEDFALVGFCMNSFCAAECAMRSVMVAYNLMSLFKQLTHRNQAQPKLSTLRFKALQLEVGL